MTPHTEKIILYGSYTCPMVPPVRGMLERTSAEFTYINISKDPEAKARVQEINAGNESVPTLTFPDGSTLTEPSLRDLEAKLEALGYEVAPATPIQQAKAIVQNPMLVFLAVFIIIIGATSNVMALMILGVILLIAGFVVRFTAR